MDCCEGGLGLFDIEQFLTAQKCTWIKRAQTLDDNWKQRLYAKSPGNILNLRSKDFNPSYEPMLYNIVIAFEKMIFNYSVKDENIRSSPIIDNPSIFYKPPNQARTVRLLDIDFFGKEAIELNGSRLRKPKCK